MMLKMVRMMMIRMMIMRMMMKMARLTMMLKTVRMMVMKMMMKMVRLTFMSLPLAIMPKTLVFTAFFALCTTCCTRMWSKTRCHKHPSTATGATALLFAVNHVVISPPPPGHPSKTPKNTEKQRLTPGAWGRA